jgi:hypothetical protein
LTRKAALQDLYKQLHERQNKRFTFDIRSLEPSPTVPTAAAGPPAFGTPGPTGSRSATVTGPDSRPDSEPGGRKTYHDSARPPRAESSTPLNLITGKSCFQPNIIKQRSDSDGTDLKSMVPPTRTRRFKFKLKSRSSPVWLTNHQCAAPESGSDSQINLNFKK